MKKRKSRKTGNAIGAPLIIVQTISADMDAAQCDLLTGAVAANIASGKTFVLPMPSNTIVNITHVGRMKGIKFSSCKGGKDYEIKLYGTHDDTELEKNPVIDVRESSVIVNPDGTPVKRHGQIIT